MREYKAWPFKEARQISKRRPPLEGRAVLFQTGFAPSGLPHMGHFSEVARTSWVRRACARDTGANTRLLSFSDDMDGLRKVPGNLPDGDMLAAHLGKTLHVIPDPFGCCDSFSGHMNNKLREFLDAYGFEYDFQSSKEAYERGDFDEGLTILLEKVEEVRDVILPTMREENRPNWSPFFPICPNCKSVYATRVTEYHPDRQTLEFVCDVETESYKGCGEGGEISVLGGTVKMGWKIDWALRWYAYDVDYEMYGKDLIDSFKASSRIVRIMGKQPPVGYKFEHFNDEHGEKISSSVGKGLTVDAWVKYAPIESLLYFLYQNPNRAKRLFWGVVPKCVDDYLDALGRYHDVPEEDRPDEDLWHVYNQGQGVPRYDAKVNFGVVNNLISALGSDEASLLMEYLGRYDPQVRQNSTVVELLVEKGLNYYREQVLPTKTFRPPTPEEQALLGQIRDRLTTSENGDEAALQAIPFDVAREAGVEPKDLFRTMYEVLLGQERGPRFGSFVLLLGKERFVQMLNEKTAVN